MPPDLKVLYILGASRSGSTILDNILNELTGFVSVGELRYLWERMVDDRWCGCGRVFTECSMWSVVLRAGFDFPGTFQPADVVRWQREAVGARQTWHLLRMANRQQRMMPESLRAYANTVSVLYREVSRATEARVVVDSSKRPSNGALLALLPEVTPYFVHLVRDPRAMAYSEQRGKLNPDRAGDGQLISRAHTWSALLWDTWNAASDAVRRSYSPDQAVLVTYERFVRDPVSTVQAIIDLVGEPVESLPFVGENMVRLRGNHTVSGNPSRFATGLIRIKQDDAWITEMSSFHKTVNTILTMPKLLQYGYPLSGRKAAEIEH
jgi:hypothetical protein